MSIKAGICSMEGIDWIEFIKSASGKGFDHIELRVNNVERGSYIFDKHYLQRVKSVAVEEGVSLSIHSLVGTNLGEKVNRIRSTSVDIIYDVMEAGEQMGALWVTTHIGSGGFSNSDIEKKYKRLDCVIKGVEDILQRSKGFKIKLALENLPRYQPTRGQCRIGDCAAEFQYIFKHISSENVGMLFDIAHARINTEKAEYVKLFIKSVEHKIIGFHVHWNDGNNDSHMPLKQECIDEFGDYLSGSIHVLGQNVPFLFECYSMEENMECLKLLSSIMRGD